MTSFQVKVLQKKFTLLHAHFSKIVLKYSNEVHLLPYLTPLHVVLFRKLHVYPYESKAFFYIIYAQDCSGFGQNVYLFHHVQKQRSLLSKSEEETLKREGKYPKNLLLDLASTSTKQVFVRDVT